ncbi:hypothetical protein C8J57DRAFT_1501603 [Mycena rebaudengoi]|nr:hypothetical protein C8J57DRAFT_1501603 [Mycena rebaudengoi]
MHLTTAPLRVLLLGAVVLLQLISAAALPLPGTVEADSDLDDAKLLWLAPPPR